MTVTIKFQIKSNEGLMSHIC